MTAKLLTLLIVYGGLSIAALLLLVIGFALARRRAEVIGVTLVCGTLVLVHAVELVMLANLGQMWVGDGIDPLLVAGAALMLLAAAATIVFYRRMSRALRLSGDMR